MTHNYTEDETREQAALYALGSLSQFEARLFEEHLDSGCDVCSAELEAFDAVVEQLAWAEASHPPPVEVREKLLARISFVAPSAADAKPGEATTAALPPLAAHSSPAQAATNATASADASSSADSLPADAAAENSSADVSAPTSASPSAPSLPAAQSAPSAGLFTVAAGAGEWEETGDEGVLVKHLFADEEHDTFTTLIRMSPGARVPRHRHKGVEQCLVLEGDLRCGAQTLKAGDFICALPGTIHEQLTTEAGNLLLIVAPASYEVLPPKPEQTRQA